MLCKLCKQPSIKYQIDFGSQALTNRFLHSADQAEYTHPLDIGVCDVCGTVQLGSVPPAEEIRPRFDWLSYNEPEGHLDDMVQVIAKLAGINSNTSFCGLSYKDESTLRRLRERGFGRTWVADRAADLGIEHPLGAIESIQQNLTRSTAKKLVKKHGRTDVVILRHVFEHAHDIHELLGALREMVSPAGYIVLEMPDATRALERCDYSTVWEEHVFYFSPLTIRRFLEQAGFDVVFLESYFYTHENSLVAILKPSLAATAGQQSLWIRADIERFAQFAEQFPRTRERYRRSLASITEAGGKVALLGAGHLSASFINLLGLETHISFVADDNANKQGMFMPGSKVPILGSSHLLDDNVRLCLMTVRPEIEEAVVRKNQAFILRGSRLASIFPGGPYAYRAA